jgi:hypothetical protein
MKTYMTQMENEVNRLSIIGASVLHLDDIDAWMFAIGMDPSERHDACMQLLAEGGFSICNIESRFELFCCT